MKPWLNVHPPNWKKSFGVINDRWWGPRMDDIQKKWYAELS
jgi:hypothetical protein